MAIRIPILTSFDPKGLKQANAQFAKLQTSMGSLGRNFAAAGVVIAGAFTLIGKSVADAADSQKVFAQTEAVLKSMGTTANGTAADLANMASALQKTTAFSDEAILAGTNLLLTFKNIQNQAGAGNDIFDQTATLMLDVARAMGTSASGEAIRLGKALNDPVKGISALTRVGIQFTDQQKSQIKALTESGDLMGAQKIILAELQQQFGGSAAAYAGTFAGQVENLNNDLNDLSEEIGFIVMPAITAMIAEFRELIPIIGPQLKAAIASVDWKGLIKSVVDFTTYLVQNAETIAKTIAIAWAFSTAIKAITVAVQLGKVAIAIHTWAVAASAAGMTAASITAGVLRVALMALPWVAVAAGLGLIVAGMTETDSSYRTTTPVVTSFGEEVLKTGHDAEWAAGKYGVATDAINKLNAAAGALPKPGRTSVLDDYAYNKKTGQPITVPTVGSVIPTVPTGAGGATKQVSALDQLLADANKNAKVTAKEAALVNKGLSADVAAWVTSTSKPIAAANQALKGLAEKPKATVKKLTAAYNKSAAGQQAVAQAAQAAAESAAQAAQELAAAQAAAAAAEAAALAERERVYQSFADSVKNTFAGIKSSIMGAFDLTQLGGSTNAITRNMEKLLTRLRSFATNVKSLATMGLNPALLQQIISAGPMAGARLAEGLAMGGASGLSAINAGYAEFGALSGQIAQTGTESLFGTGQQQTVYNINVDGGVGSGSTIGKAIVDAIKAYERTSGAVWQGA
jgi:hypothetical protein